MPPDSKDALKVRLALPAKGETRKSRQRIERADQAVRKARKLVKDASSDSAVDGNPKLRKQARRSAKDCRGRLPKPIS